MISIWVAPQFLKTSVLWRLLTLIFTVSWPLASQESVVAQIQLGGEVGKNVTIRCPVDQHKTIQFFYFQRGGEFVNGFHILRNITKEKWENTRVENNNANVQMIKLKASYSGDYQCYIQYNERPNVSVTGIHLSVTANYSKPAVTTFCSAHRCLSTCASHGGYPHTELMWNVENSSGLTWKVLNVSEESDPKTLLYNISSTVSFNCSDGEETFISCSVGGVTSESLSVCIPKYHIPIVKTAICSVMLFIATIPLVLAWKYIKQKKSAAVTNLAVDPREIKALN
ncbi:uncharacterized protein LOC109525368 [Hippocampus comes]|uniref:uncharacterized protein LOC109525368 n=1 Tax=Hippocampus comes TaxID=109280 RepID=UPI00094F0A89|nr:PREDICTED: uncharacterized protein LOC109525368 [Hippocampus comes]